MKKLQLIIKILLSIFTIFSLSIFSYNIFKLNVIPLKYLIIGYSLLLLIFTVIIVIFLKTKKIILLIISVIFIFLINTGLIYITNYIKETYNFLSNTQIKEDALSYSVIILKTNSSKKIEDIANTKIGYLKNDNLKDIKENITTKIKYEEVTFEDSDTLINNLYNKSITAIILEESHLSVIKELNSEFENKTKVIHTFEITTKVTKEENTIDVLKEPFILYLSGIDQYGNVNSVRGRSDVNQLIVVNPKTHKILLVNTPRDYYVQLSGTTGLKDKLTHAGIYGIDKSIKTLEEFYNIDINHYVRVNFNTVIKLVDVIGGIDIYSDKSFRPHTNKSVYVNKGWNNFNGKEALAYARERYTYIDGDHHRGRNQQQVITAIIEKISNSSVIIKNYNSILSVLSKSFQTDIDTNLITSFIRYQLSNMPKWNVESIQVTGYNSSNYTYSMGYNYLLYVMEPNFESVNIAKKRIGEVLNET